MRDVPTAKPLIPKHFQTRDDETGKRIQVRTAFSIKKYVIEERLYSLPNDTQRNFRRETPSYGWHHSSPHSSRERVSQRKSQPERESARERVSQRKVKPEKESARERASQRQSQPERESARERVSQRKSQPEKESARERLSQRERE